MDKKQVPPQINNKTSVIHTTGRTGKVIMTIGLVALSNSYELTEEAPSNYGSIGFVDTDPYQFAHSNKTYVPTKSNKKSKRNIFKKR